MSHTHPPVLRLHTDELIVDSFAGGGGASLGIEMALGRSPDIAINHDPEAIAMHQANHPNTRHYCESVWDVDPVEATGGKPVGLAWFSPDCTFHSKARGGKPFRDRNKARRRRGLAWLVVRWAKAVKPRIIFLENVEEFKFWGPLNADGTPCKQRRGRTFSRWVAQLRNAGYNIEYRELRACPYNDPTTRKRLFLIARCDGLPIVWPEPTNGPGRTQPYRVTADCIDWDEPSCSIFATPEQAREWAKAHGREAPKRPLAEKTMARIARGLDRYVIGAADPFIVPLTHQGKRRVHPIDEPFPTVTGAHRGEHAVVTPFVARIGQTGGNGAYVSDLEEPLTTVTTKAEHLLVSPTLIQTGYGEREGQAPRSLDIHQPLGTVVGTQKHALVAAHLAKHNGGNEATGQQLTLPIDTITTVDQKALVTSHLVKLRGGLEGRKKTGEDLRDPAPTLTASGTHLAQVMAFLIKYYGTDGDPQIDLPLHTITTKDRFGLVTVKGTLYTIIDIHMRMLTPRELYRCQGFPDSYKIDIIYKGKPLSKSAQVRMCGNSVPPGVAAALVRANYFVASSGEATVPRADHGLAAEQMTLFDLMPTGS